MVGFKWQPFCTNQLNCIIRCPVFKWLRHLFTRHLIVNILKVSYIQMSVFRSPLYFIFKALNLTDEPLATSEQLSSPQLSNAQAIRNISELNEARLRALNFMDNEPLATSKQLSNPQLSNAQAMRNISALAELNEARLRDTKRQLQFALQTSFPPPPFIQMPPPIPMPVMGPQHGKCFRYRLQL